MKMVKMERWLDGLRQQICYILLTAGQDTEFGWFGMIPLCRTTGWSITEKDKIAAVGKARPTTRFLADPLSG